MPILSRVRAYVREHGMLAPGDSVLVAVSGGPDSVTLLHVLRRLQQELDLRLHVFHMNHGLRGASSAADAEFVKALCERWSIPASVVTLPEGLLKGQPGSLQANARSIRYAELEKVARQVGARVLAIGQNRDDQAETVLMRFLRGSGPRGLGGIAPVRAHDGLLYIRPLLHIPRADIENYCRVHELNARVDESNLVPDYARNRIRIELLPRLAREYNPSLAENLVEIADIFREEDRYLSELAAAEMERCRLPGEGVALSGDVLLAVPPALARRIVRLAAEEASDGRSEPGPELVSAVLSLAQRREGTHRLDLPGRLQVLAEYGVLRFLCAEVDQPGGLWHRLSVPGVTNLPEWGLTITVSNGTGGPNHSGIHLDLDRLPGPLAVRVRRPGDRLYPVGMEGSKKIQDILVDAKVPRRLRDRLPLLVAGEEVLWVIGYRVDRRFLAGTSTRSAVAVTVEQSGETLAE